MYISTYVPANVPPVPVANVTASTFPSIEEYFDVHAYIHMYICTYNIQ